MKKIGIFLMSAGAMLNALASNWPSSPTSTKLYKLLVQLDDLQVQILHELHSKNPEFVKDIDKGVTLVNSEGKVWLDVSPAYISLNFPRIFNALLQAGADVK